MAAVGAQFGKPKVFIKFRFIGEITVAKSNIPLSRGNVSEADKGVASAK